MELFIEQAYRETKSCDFAVITERVYDLVKQDETALKEASTEKPEEALLKGKDHKALLETGMVDSEQW